MRVRIATSGDTEALLEMGAAMAAELRPELQFDPAMWRAAVVSSFNQASPTFFVCEDGDRIVGFLKAFIQEYSFASGFLVSQELWYVRPEKRGTRAAARLMQAFIDWGLRIKAKELYAGVASPVHPQRTVRLLEALGFSHVGATLRRVGDV